MNNEEGLNHSVNFWVFLNTKPQITSSPFQFFGLSDIGLNRSSNQDFWGAFPEIGLFALADGMGGRNGGKTAAREAIYSLSQSIRPFSIHTGKPSNLSQSLLAAIEHANSWVYKLGCEIKPLMGMGTTLACLLWTEQKIYYAHVGDSRIYHYKKNRLNLLTQDHSLFARWLLKKDRSTPSPPKNIITRAIGTRSTTKPELGSLVCEDDDLFLLCSDGLSDTVNKEELEKIIKNNSNLQQAAQKMIATAKNKGSNDNITALLIKKNKGRSTTL